MLSIMHLLKVDSYSSIINKPKYVIKTTNWILCFLEAIWWLSLIMLEIMKTDNNNLKIVSILIILSMPN